VVFVLSDEEIILVIPLNDPVPTGATVLDEVYTPWLAPKKKTRRKKKEDPGIIGPFLNVRW
jgi:hypothetical protein